MTFLIVSRILEILDFLVTGNGGVRVHLGTQTWESLCPGISFVFGQQLDFHMFNLWDHGFLVFLSKFHGFQELLGMCLLLYGPRGARETIRKRSPGREH